jgi:hypothetical protein
MERRDGMSRLMLTLAPAEFRDAVFATQTVQHNADFLNTLRNCASPRRRISAKILRISSISRFIAALPFGTSAIICWNPQTACCTLGSRPAFMNAPFARWASLGVTSRLFARFGMSFADLRVLAWLMWHGQYALRQFAQLSLIGVSHGRTSRY